MWVCHLNDDEFKINVDMIGQIGDELTALFTAKMDGSKELLPLFKTRDRHKILTIIIKNMVDDVAFVGCVRHKIGIDPDPFPDVDKKQLSLLLFEILR